MSNATMHRAARAREMFLAEGACGEDLGVRPEILESWRRSVLHGLTPAGALPRETPDTDLDSPLLRAALPVIESRRATLCGLRAGLTLTDQEGRLTGRWVEDRSFARRLDARCVLPGMSISELTVGTSSCGISLETGQAILVAGYEHFSDGAVTMTTAGAPIRHPVSRRILGSLNLTCAASDTSALMLAWVTELVDTIRHRLLEAVASGKRLLFDAFLTSTQDARHPMVCLDESLVITNAAAARLLGGGDNALLWELAACSLSGQETRGRIALSSGYTIDVTGKAVTDGDGSVGAILQLTQVRPPSAHQRADSTAAGVQSSLARLPGRSGAWTRFACQVSQAWAQCPVLLITGEAGTGKSTVAAALADSSGPAVMLDAEVTPGEDWARSLQAALSDTTGVVTLRRLDLLSSANFEATLRLVSTRVPGGGRVIATARAASEDEAAMSRLLDWPGTIATAPPLRERLDDLPALLAAMPPRNPGCSNPRWSAEVVQILSRLGWPANLHTLHSVAASVSRAVVGPVIEVKDLPTTLVASGSRRRLVGLERVEAHAITTALRTAGGNKREAADALGIARSTLYRKMRALGLSLGSTTF
jgi:transcriptional regulator of acetoin/glycerol metabolism